MKKLLIPLLFLLTFSTSLNASPWSHMLKGGIKGSSQSVSSTSGKKYLFRSREVDVYRKYDAWNESTTCIFDPKGMAKSYFKINWEGYVIEIVGSYSSSYSDSYRGYKFDNSSPVPVSIQYPKRITIPYSEWRKNKKLIIRDRGEYVFDLQTISKAIEIHKKCKRR